MTKEEVNMLIALMKANYSYAFKSMTRSERVMLLNTWTLTLQDMDANVVMLAAMQIISENKWLPTVAEIREKCRTLHYAAVSARFNAGWNEMSEEKRAAYETIAAKTEHMRGNDGAGLTLEAMMNNPHMAAISTGQQNMDMLESTNWIESDLGGDEP